MADNSASTQANRLWPYLLPRIQKVSRNGNGGGGGSAVSGGRLATLQDVNLVTPTDGQVLTYDSSTAMWRNEDATGGGGGGGPTYTAGNGIAIAADVISTKQQAAGGVAADSNGLYVKHPSDSGLVVDTAGIKVGAGIGIDILGGVTSVNALDITDTTLGLGVSSNKIYMRAEAGGGIEFNPGDGSVRVDEDADFLWTGTHQFNAQIQMHAGLNFIAADRTITSSAGVDVTWDLGGDLLLASDRTERSTDFADAIPIAGYSLFPNSGGDRQLTINTIKSDSLHTRLFVADGVRIDLGEEYWGKSLGIVYADFTSPASIGSFVHVIFEDSPAIAGAIFEAGDWILIRYLNGAVGAEFAYGSIWGQVTTYTPLGADANGRGRQRWSFTYRHGDAGVLVKKGNIAVDFGVSGQGYVHLSTLQSADGPWIRIGDWTGANPYGGTGLDQLNSQIRTQIGLLDGIGDAALNPSGWGLYSDNAYLHGMLRTAESIMDDDGLALQYSHVATEADLLSEHSLISWWDDLGVRTGEPIARVSAHQSTSTPGAHLDMMRVQNWKSGDSIGAFLTLRAIDAGDGPTYFGASLYLTTTHGAEMWARNTWFYGNALPGEDMNRDLGSASYRWKTLYADQIIVSGAVSGTSIDGQTWEYPGSMVIDAHTAGSTTVSVTNSGAGSASLDVDGNITLGGTVDGVDISAHVANPAAHHALATAGDGIIVIGQQIWLDAAAVAGAGLVAAAGQVLNIGAGSGILVSANSIAIDPAYAMPTTRRVDTTAPLAGGGELSVDLTLGLTLAPTGGLGTTGGLGLAASVAGSGLTMTAGVLDVGVGAGLVVDTSTITLNPLLAGNGLTLAAGVLAVGAGDGLVANANDMALDPLVGGAGLTYAAGVLAVGAAAGIQVNANNVQIALASPSGLNTTSGLAVDASLAGAGLALSAGVMAVGAGVGIQVNANDVQVLLAASSGLNTTSGLAIDATLAGAGLALSAGKVLSVNAAKGVMIGAGVDADNVIVNTAYAFSWSGTHTFGADVQLNANLDFIGGTRSITSPAATNLSILPGGDLILDPGGYNVLPGGGTRTDLGDYNRKWSTLYARELYVETLVASSVMATIGGRVMVTPTSSLINDVTVGATTIDLKHNIASFVSGTYLYLESAPGGIPQIEAMKITSASPTTITGPPAGFRYTVTRGLNSSGAKAWLAGDAVVSLGKNVSEGYIDLASVQTVKPISPSVQKIGPTITIYSRSSTTNWDDLVPTVTMGNLTSFVDYSSTRFGFATGNDLTLAPDAGFSGLTADRVAGVRLFNTALNLYNVGNAVLSLDKTNGLSFEYGTNLFNTIGWYEDLGVPPAAPDPTKLLGTVGVARAIAGYTELDIIATGIAGSYTTGAVKLRGVNSAAAQYNVWLDSSGAYFGSGSGARSQTGGYISDAVQYFSGNVGINQSAPEDKLQVSTTLVDSTIQWPIIIHAQRNLSLVDLGIGLKFNYETGASKWAGIGTYQETAAANKIGMTFWVHNQLVSPFEAMRITAAGNVGIGTTSPTLPLYVMGSAYLQGPVGINTDTPVSGYNLDVANNIRARSRVYAKGTGTVGTILMESGTTGVAGWIGWYRPSVDGTTGVRSGYIGSHATNINLQLENSADFTVIGGNVGIGTSAPGTYLHIGTTTPGNSSNPGLWVTPPNGTATLNIRNTGNVEAILMAHTATVYAGAYTNHPFVLRTNNADRITIAAAGAVTVTPAMTVTGLITANGGVSFGNETLQDYDEGPGTWSVTITGSTTNPNFTYTTRQQNYTRVGNRVDYWMVIQVGTVTTGGAGTLRISLPFASSTANNQVAVAFTATPSSAVAVFLPTAGQLYGTIGPAVGGLQLPVATNWQFVISGTYFV